MCSTPGSVPNRGADTFINFDEKFPDFSELLFHSVLLMPARLFDPAFLFGTLKYLICLILFCCFVP